MTGRDFGLPAAADRTAPGAASASADRHRRAARDGFAPLKGKRVGLVTNHTGRARDGAAPSICCTRRRTCSSSPCSAPSTAFAAFSTRTCRRRRDEKTGLPIHSLYGETRRPTDAMLDGIDTIVIDLQDVGARFYTYTRRWGT